MRRLEQLIEGLMSSPDHVSGKRPYPREVTRDDAADIAEGLHAQVEAGTTARADAATQQGMKLACAPGCHACCEELVMVTLPEAHAVARWLLRPEHAAAKDAFLARYPAWRAAVGDAPQQIADAGARGDRARHAELHVKTRALCALNDGGMCQVYEARPITCRTAHALDTPDLCRPHAAELGPPRQLAFVPLDRFVDRARMLLWSAHHALPRGKRMRQVALCEAVYELVARG
jgi:hypothetical protein